MEPEITTKHLQGMSDLTLTAPVNQDLIPTLDTRTYMSRLRAVLATLHLFRQSSREHSLVRPFSDSTDRIRTITDLRMAILEPEQKLLLSVTFDRPWEPYLRIIWRDVGTLLDVIFCNCKGYVTSFDHTFAEYGQWIRGARANTQFFYKPSALTFDDAQYLRQTEKLLSDVPAPLQPDLEAARLVAADPEQIARATALRFLPHTARQGMQALSVLYRLADVYPPGTRDGGILLRAAKQLLRELTLISIGLPAPVRQRFAAQLAWFEEPPPPSAQPVIPVLGDTRDVQGGILNEYVGVTHGCVLLISVRDPVAGADFLAKLQREVSTEGASKPADSIYVNVALTVDGLRALGLSESEMAAFPHEFCEGMQERAGLIGDVRGNHPEVWALPERNWPGRIVAPATGNAALVQLTTVHIVVQMCMQSTDPGYDLIAPLQAKVTALMAGHPNVRLLSVQPMRRYIDSTLDKPREHFGLIDGMSQPDVGQRPAGNAWSNFVGLGELLLGYKNDRGDDPEPNELLRDGSFLVIRKLRQDVKALNDAIAASGIAPDALKAKMLGRTVDGDPLASPGSGNKFDYTSDTDASRCPFQAHVRRANPRMENNALGRPTVPRIMRRGMSYGPLFKDQPNAERGIMFMCYNASIAEQFEVIQRWISGGNSTGVLSEHSDPLNGVPQLGEARTFRYHDGASVTRVMLDDAIGMTSRPFVRLEWGVYVFAPSKTALNKLEAIARAATGPTGPAPSVIEQGEKIIENLRQFENQPERAADLWKAVLEDSHARTSGESEAVWAAIRERHNGVLRTPYGVLVGSKALVMQVYGNAHQEYSVCGYVPRLKDSSGEMYLGLDDKGAGSAYRKQSTDTNAAIYAIPEQEAFGRARAYAANRLTQMIRATVALAKAVGEPTWELTLDVKEVSDETLARLCEEWFSLKDDGKPFKAGGWPWTWKPGDPPLYPGHFTAPSRYVFQPNPGIGQVQLGQLRGEALKTAMIQFVNNHRAAGTVPIGLLAKAMFGAFPQPADNELLARTILGTLIGFLPTVEGNFRATLNEWLGGGTLRLTLNERLEQPTFWDLQNKFLSDTSPDAYQKACNYLKAPLIRTMQLRPAPELGWRTAVKAHRLGDLDVLPGEKIVAAIVSATQEDLAAGRTDAYPVFGGDRGQPGHPTHACPGHKIGMGVLLGMITALMEMGPVRPTAAALTLCLRGTTPP